MKEERKKDARKIRKISKTENHLFAVGYIFCCMNVSVVPVSSAQHDEKYMCIKRACVAAAAAATESSIQSATKNWKTRVTHNIMCQEW